MPVSWLFRNFAPETREKSRFFKRYSQILITEKLQNPKR